jgi:hypothetical protein
MPILYQEALLIIFKFIKNSHLRRYLSQTSDLKLHLNRLFIFNIICLSLAARTINSSATTKRILNLNYFASFKKLTTIGFPSAS